MNLKSTWTTTGSLLRRTSGTIDRTELSSRPSEPGGKTAHSPEGRILLRRRSLRSHRETMSLRRNLILQPKNRSNGKNLGQEKQLLLLMLLRKNLPDLAGRDQKRTRKSKSAQWPQRDRKDKFLR